MHLNIKSCWVHSKWKSNFMEQLIAWVVVSFTCHANHKSVYNNIKKLAFNFNISEVFIDKCVACGSIVIFIWKNQFVLIWFFTFSLLLCSSRMGSWVSMEIQFGTIFTKNSYIYFLLKTKRKKSHDDDASAGLDAFCRWFRVSFFPGFYFLSSQTDFFFYWLLSRKLFEMNFTLHIKTFKMVACPLINERFFSDFVTSFFVTRNCKFKSVLI